MPVRPRSSRATPPRAPTQREWDLLDAAARKRVVDALPGGNALLLESAELVERLEREMAAVEARVDEEARNARTAQALLDEERRLREEESRLREEAERARATAERRVEVLERQLKAARATRKPGKKR